MNYIFNAKQVYYDEVESFSVAPIVASGPICPSSLQVALHPTEEAF